MDPSIDREEKLDTLLDIMEKMMYILDKRLDRHEVDIDVDYPEQPINFWIKYKLNHYKTYTTSKICMMRKFTERKMKNIVKKVLIAYLYLVLCC